MVKVTSLRKRYIAFRVQHPVTAVTSSQGSLEPQDPASSIRHPAAGIQHPAIGNPQPAIGIQFDEEKLKRAIYFEALKFFGEYGLSFAALKLISYDREKQIAILRCERDHYQKTLGFLALVNELDNKPARTIAIAGSGTLAALRKKIAEKTNQKSN